MSRIHTYVDIDGRTVAAGDAHVNFRRGRLTATFSYDRDYLSSRSACAIDPALGMILLDAGTGSLCGARPNASVRDTDRLMIAKFPHHVDEWSVIAWEKTALDVAGVTVPKRQLVGVEGNPVLLLERFDRRGTNRIGYFSAMTLLEAQDGQRRDYTEIAEAIPEHGRSRQPCRRGQSAPDVRGDLRPFRSSGPGSPA